MENKFQFSNKTGQRGVPTKYFGTLGQQVEKRYCPGQNGTSGHFSYEHILQFVTVNASPKYVIMSLTENGSLYNVLYV